MKHLRWVCFALLGSWTAMAQVETSSIVERQLDYAVHKTTRMENVRGQLKSVTNTFTTVATGMNRWENGQLVACDPVIEILAPNGAAARKTRHQVIFSADVADWQNGTIDLQTPDSKRLIFRPLGISYYDTANGQSVLIAELTNSIGAVFPPSTVVYQNCFTDFAADLEYENALAGFEQFLIFRENLPPPSDYGLNNNSTVLQLLNETFNPPVPAKQTVIRNGLESDDVLDFGAMQIPRGKSFLAGNPEQSVTVDKQWKRLNGRDFLIEQVPYTKIAPLLGTLPQHAGIIKPDKVRHIVSKERLLPTRRVATIKSTNAIRVAQVPWMPKGLLWDFSVVSSASNFTFKGDTTYLVTNAVNLTGLTTFEGGSVIKFTNKSSAQITLSTNVWKSGPFRPVVFTSMHDNTVGDTISGSTGNPWTNYSGAGISCSLASTNQYARFSFLTNAIQLQNGLGSPHALKNLQFVKCKTALLVDDGEGDPNVANLDNALFYAVDTVISGYEFVQVNVRHITANECNYLNAGKTTVNLTNCLLTAVTNWTSSAFSTITSNYVVSLSSSSGVYQEVGAAKHYLATNSIYRDYGTTNLPSDTLADLRIKSTFPPVVISTNIFANVTLQPRATRDTDTPDLGFHYDPLDYCTGNGTILSNANLTLTNGVALGFYSDDPGFFPPCALEIQSGGKVVSEGAPTNLNHVTWYNTVQEQSSTNWTRGQAYEAIACWDYSGAVPEIRCRFTDFSALAGGFPHIGRGDVGLSGIVCLRDSQFHGASLDLQVFAASNDLSVAFTNCLFERCALNFYGSSLPLTVYAYNNLFYGSPLWTEDLDTGAGTATLTFRDNFFYTNTISQSADVTVTHDHNAYITNYNHLSPTGTGDLFLTNFTFATGTLGYYYQLSTNLIDKGSRNATNAGLYHFTTQTNQVKETNSTVDIGYHYVALENGAPADTDWDSVPDYVEDSNGDGVFGSPDLIDWLNGFDGTLRVWITEPSSNSNLP